MSLERKIARTQLKKQFKEHNKGVAKKYRTKFSDFWKWYQRKRKKGEL